MARDELRIRRHFLDGVFDIANIATHIASSSEINIWKAAREKRIAKMDNVRARKVYNAVTVCMGRRHVHQLDLLAVKKNRKRVIEGDDWKLGLGITRFAGKTFAHVAMGNDACFSAEVCI